MKARDIKEIEIHAREYCSKLYGNTYFTARVVIRQKDGTAEPLDIPKTYGYGEHILDVLLEILRKKKNIFTRGKFATGYTLRGIAYTLNFRIILYRTNVKMKDLHKF